MLLTYPREMYDEYNLDKNIILKLITKHKTIAAKFVKNKKYYLGEHEFDLRDKGPNNKVISNHAKNITDTATGYFLGETIRYDGEGIEPILVALDEAEIDEIDHDNAIDMSIYGIAYEYVYVKENENVLDVKNLEPENTFMVYDDSIEQKPLFAVYYYTRKDSISEKTYYFSNVFTKNLVYSLRIDSSVSNQEVFEVPIQHNLGEIPVIVYQNNKYMIGDFEQQISLIDAYNKLCSTRINDKEQFINSIIMLYGANFADEPEEMKRVREELQNLGLLELPLGAKAEYLTKTLDETGVEILRKAIQEDIYTFSHIPNLSDERFAGNTSGVAMEFKLLGLMMITKTKERYYRKALRKRLRIFANYLNVTVDTNAIVPRFSRGLPKNLLELSQIINNLSGKVTDKTLISLLPFVEDPDFEVEEVIKNKDSEIFDVNTLNKSVEEYE